MPTTRGFVAALQVRGDGWVEFAVISPHSGDSLKTLFIPDLDSDLAKAHKRLAWLSLLRDALARSLPLEVEYVVDDKLGEVVEDVSVFPRASLTGRRAMRSAEGVVVNVGVGEVGPVSGGYLYKDESDLAAIALLRDDGAIEQFFLDLQRPDPLTAQAMLKLLSDAHRTRRPVTVGIADRLRQPSDRVGTAAAASADTGLLPFAQVCAYVALPASDLAYCHAFLERLGQRYESYDEAKAPAAWKVRVRYTTAPSQTPEGDISDNGGFLPETREAWVHGDSPLLARLETALRHGFQVKLGLSGEDIHEVEVVSLLGSASRPVWVRMERCLLPGPPGRLCDNVPTVRGPDAAQLSSVPYSVEWAGEAFFVQGIWRFAVRSATPFSLAIDGKNPCCASAGDPADKAKGHQAAAEAAYGSAEAAYGSAKAAHGHGRGYGQEADYYSPPAKHICHVYLDGLHAVTLRVEGRTCDEPFELSAYRIR